MTNLSELVRRQAPPGSHLAIKYGCKCDLIVNRLGAGIDNGYYWPVFIVAKECKIHNAERLGTQCSYIVEGQRTDYRGDRNVHSLVSSDARASD